MARPLSSSLADSPSSKPWGLRLLVGYLQHPVARLACVGAGSSILLAQPNALLWPGLALLAVPWLSSLATRTAVPRSPLDVPLVLFLAGAGVGLAATSDPITGAIRWWGILAACAAAYAVMQDVRSESASRWALSGAIAFGIVGGLVVLLLSRGDVARGFVGELIAPFLAWFAWFPGLSAPVMETNTRYIVNYNGVADMALVTIVAGLLLLGHSRATIGRGILVAVVAIASVLLLATGGRGGILGLMVALLVLALTSLRAMIEYVPGSTPRAKYLVASLLVVLGLSTVGAGLGLTGLLDKGLELDSVAGRIVFWTELLAILGDYPYTGVGLGMQAPLHAIIFYGATTSPSTMVYAHNMFVQTLMEQGPLGLVSLTLFLLVAGTAGFLAVRRGLHGYRRTAARLGLALLAGLTAHGLTDQVPTTNIGTLMLFLAGALCVAQYLSHPGDTEQPALTKHTFKGRVLLLAALVLSLSIGFGLSRTMQPADFIANLGALQVAKAAAAAEDAQRQELAASADGLLRTAMEQSPDHAVALRSLARLRLLQNDPGGAARALQQATTGALSPYDGVQIGRLYYQLGFLEEGRRWTHWGNEASGGLHAAAAYEYDRLQLDRDWRVRTLVEQAEMLQEQREYERALPLFERALQLAPENSYLADQIERLRSRL